MYDQRGVKRSFCTECNGEEVCEEFERSEKTPFCGYCGCPPIKHKRMSDTDVPNNVDAPNNLDSINNVPNSNETSSSICDSSILPQPLTNSKENLKSLLPELPHFSQCVENALNNGRIHGPLWSNMIMQCATYYTKSEIMKTKSAYELVGRIMFDKYPCIEGPGSKPWSHFTKCLSQKIRTERLKIKSFNTSIGSKHFSALANGNSDGSEASKRRQAFCEKKRTFFRSEANIPCLLSKEEILLSRQKIKTEWEKESPENALIKSLIRDTFNDRTSLLKEGASFQVFIQHYPVFKDATYVLYEFSMLLGRSKMLELSQKMKEFFEKLQNLNKSGLTLGDGMLSDWMFFEKKCGVFQTKGEKSSPIIEVVFDHAEYHRKLLEIHDFPSGIVLLQENEIKDCAVVYGEHFIQCPQLSTISLLTLLLAVYYILEINYPKRHMQAMGALAHLVLNHQFYKLGLRAGQMIRVVK